MAVCSPVSLWDPESLECAWRGKWLDFRDAWMKLWPLQVKLLSHIQSYLSWPQDAKVTLTKSCLCLQLAFRKSSLLLSASLWFKVRMFLAHFPCWTWDDLREIINSFGAFCNSHSQESLSASLGICWKCCISAAEIIISDVCSSAQQLLAQPRNVPLT